MKAFWKAFVEGLADLACFGGRPLDIPDYPHASEADALMSDWEALGGDFKRAVERVQTEPH